MIKMFYQMMTSGYTYHVTIMGKVFKLPEGVKWNVPYFSQPQYVVGQNEEACLNKIRQKMQKKYEGFIVRGQAEI